MKKVPGLLLVSGAGRNVGKSTLVSQLISKFKDRNLIAIKISPHFHENNPRNIPYIIEREHDPERSKDSSRFLRAGAAEVYYLQVHDEHLEEAFAQILNYNTGNLPMIAESGGLSKFIKPGLLLFVEGKEPAVKNEVVKQKADKVLKMNDEGFNIDDIKLVYGKWKLEDKL